MSLKDSNIRVLCPCKQKAPFLKYLALFAIRASIENVAKRVFIRSNSLKLSFRYAVDDGESPEPVLSSGLNLAPLLHDCFLRNAYNREHPPLRATALYEPLPVRALIKIMSRASAERIVSIVKASRIYTSNKYCAGGIRRVVQVAH